MTKLAWTTDIHLNLCYSERRKCFYRKINKMGVDALVITGDISEGNIIVRDMKNMASELNVPVFFVLGNHDYYQSSIKDVRDNMRYHFTCHANVGNQLDDCGAFWLGSQPFIELNEKTALVGHDGWYDGGYANWFKSQLVMADYSVITDFRYLTTNLLFERIQELAKESADYVFKAGLMALKDHDHLVIATHVPPWREAATYKGKISDDTWMPHFSSKFMGVAIEELAERAATEGKKITVLCGHTHGASVVKVRDNVECHTGCATYRKPKINMVLDL